MGKPRDLANVVATGNILADGAVAPAELTGVNATAAEINILDGVTATAAELNLLDGVTATTAELNHVDGVTSNVQTQMDTKAPVADPTFTGTATAPTVNASTALQIGGVAVTATAAELNKMDGVTVSASDINAVTAKLPLSGGTLTGNIAHASDLTFDVGGEIALDADGGIIRFKDGGSDIGLFSIGGTDFTIRSLVSDRDIIFKGNDGGSTITALTLDMSDSGTANFHRPRSNTAGDCALTVDPSDTVVEYGFRIDTANNAFNIDRVDNTTNLFSISAVGDASFAEELIAKSYNETYVSLSAASSVTIDCETGNVFALTTGQNTTFTFSNPPASGTAYGFTLKLTAGGGHSITYPNSVDFAGGTAPDAPASGETDVLVFFTIDGGTNWYGALAIDAAG